MYKITFKKFKGHIKTILKHKYWVFYFCCKAGIPFRGLIHDFSKFSHIEFWESVRYYQGTSSPINVCKSDQGYSLAWQHHKGRNPHHYEYWIDYLDQGGEPIMMPFKYVLEMICDYLGAASVYTGHKVNYTDELNWWTDKNNAVYPPKMNEYTKRYVTVVLDSLSRGYDIFNYNSLKFIYQVICEKKLTIKYKENNI